MVWGAVFIQIQIFKNLRSSRGGSRKYIGAYFFVLAIRLIRDKYDAQRYQVSPVSRSEYLYAFAPTQNFQDIENNISNVYLSKVLPAKTPQSLFRLFATNLHKMSPVKVAQHRRLP